MTTPMRKQYLQIKQQYPDTILFFRLGDFYETFDRDAEIVAQICDIVLTSRPVGKNMRVPLAGVPYHAVDGYIAKLIEAGYKVAIAEQADTTNQKGLMDRHVTEVVTPGTVVEPALLQAKQNSYLMAVFWDATQVGMAYVDVSTGEFATTQLEAQDPFAAIHREFDRLQPRECLVPEGDHHGQLEQLAGMTHLSPYELWHFDLDNARLALQEQFQVAALDGFGCAHLPLAIQAAGAIIQYLRDTRRHALAQLDHLTTYSLRDFMVLDASTRRNLELVRTIREGKTRGSLLGILDKTITPMGGRLLRTWLNQPLLDLQELQARQQIVAAFHTANTMRAMVRDQLKGIGDLERLASRVAQAIATPHDLCGLRAALEGVPGIQEAITAAAQNCPPLAELASRLHPNTEIVALIQQAICEEAPTRLGNGDVIAPGFSPELDQLRDAAQQGKAWIAALEASERERTGIKSLKVGYNKVFGYYIEITKAQLRQNEVPDNYIRKQTLVSAERFITPELKEQESVILNAEEHLAELEAQVYHQVLTQASAHAPRLLATARALAELDGYANLAEIAALNRYVKPDITTNFDLHINASRHPVVEQQLGPGVFEPNDIHLTEAERILIITGPNMAGKSTILRQVALIMLMAQIGSFVPADSATIGLTDRIFTRVGAQDDIAAGQSTFMVEMIEVANILNNATQRSLLILDEVGRGTSTYDGISLAWATVEYLHNHPRLQAKTLFATHYHELTELEQRLPRVRNYNVAVAEEGDQVVFMHRLEPGSADRSYGIHVAQLAGLPRAVIHRAEEILDQLEAESESNHIGPHHLVREAQQLSLFAGEHPVVAALGKLDVMAMSPLEALNKLFELQKQVSSQD